MPSVLPLLDDEITALRGTLHLQRNALSDSVVTALQAVIERTRTTQDKINTFWPPIVGDD